MTRTSTGAVCGSSLKPSCCSMAVSNGAVLGSGFPDGGKFFRAPAGSAGDSPGPGSQVRSISYFPVRLVLSCTERPVMAERLATNSFIGALRPSRPPCQRNRRRLPQGGGGGGIPGFHMVVLGRLEGGPQSPCASVIFPGSTTTNEKPGKFLVSR